MSASTRANSWEQVASGVTRTVPIVKRGLRRSGGGDTGRIEVSECAVVVDCGPGPGVSRCSTADDAECSIEGLETDTDGDSVIVSAPAAIGDIYRGGRGGR